MTTDLFKPNKMKRRDFLEQATATTALVTLGGIGLQSFSTLNTKQITILHTNDVHSHIDPFGPEDGRNANQGGVARRASLIESIRKENPNTLLLDAGDIFVIQTPGGGGFGSR